MRHVYAECLRTWLIGIPACRNSSMRQSMKLLEWCVAAWMIGALTALLITGPDFDQTHRYPTAIPNSEINLSDIAGEYLIEHKYGARHLSILVDGRYSTFSKACTGVGGRESGYLRRAGTCWVLSPTKADEILRELVLLPVHWESRCYLIPPERMEEFCDAIISGNEPRNAGHGDYYLRFPHDQVSEVPELPEQWATYLRQNLLTGKIIEVMDGGRVKIDVGKSKGIELGGVLALQGRENYRPRFLFVVSVEDGSCIGKDPDLGSAEPPLSVGQRVVAKASAP